jgi:hypothetical protein
MRIASESPVQNSAPVRFRLTPLDCLTTSFGTASNLKLDLFSNLPGADGATGAAPENDELIADGSVSLTLGGTLTVRNAGIGSFAQGDRWDLFDWIT